MRQKFNYMKKYGIFGSFHALACFAWVILSLGSFKLGKLHTCVIVRLGSFGAWVVLIFSRVVMGL
jgi:hypothetical protein